MGSGADHGPASPSPNTRRLTHIRTPVSRERTVGLSSPHSRVVGAESSTVPNSEGDPSMRLTTCRMALIAAAISSLLVPAAASATATPEQITTAMSNGVTYLKSLQNSETGALSG